MKTIKNFRDDHGINVKWIQNAIGSGMLKPKMVGSQWFFFDDEAIIIVAIWQSHQALGTLPRESYEAMAAALRVLFEKDKRRKGIVYLTMDEASWKPIAPALAVRLG